jgi:hypothetical protein
MTSFEDANVNAGKYMLTTAKWPKWYAYMQNNDEGNVRSWGSDPGHQGLFQFKSVKGRDNTFLISTVKWPDWFMYIQDNEKGNVRGWKGDPGEQGYWKLKCVPSSPGHYVLCSVKWPDWFIYIQDNEEGNVRSWQGDPGEQGHFKLHAVGGKAAHSVKVKEVECVLAPIYQIEKGVGFRKETELTIKVGTRNSTYSENQLSKFASQARAKCNWGVGGAGAEAIVQGSVESSFASASLEVSREEAYKEKIFIDTRNHGVFLYHGVMVMKLSDGCEVQLKGKSLVGFKENPPSKTRFVFS